MRKKPLGKKEEDTLPGAVGVFLSQLSGGKGELLCWEVDAWKSHENKRVLRSEWFFGK